MTKTSSSSGPRQVCFPFSLSEQESTPFAVIGSNTVVEARGQRVRGRLYPWGIVEGTFTCSPFLKVQFGHDEMLSMFLSPVENHSHCDFVKLRNMLICSHMHDLKDVTCDIHYENYRAQCIQEMTRYLRTQESASSGALPASPSLCPFFSVNWLRKTTWRVPSPSCRSPHTLGRLRNSSESKTRR